jgi:hypothetical protein
MAENRDPYGWCWDFDALRVCDPTALARVLERRFPSRGHEQFRAWTTSLAVLRATADQCTEATEHAASYAAILEYVLPRDVRRPDVVVLENGTVLVIEFKEGARISAADVDQVQAYARDLREYHAACHERHIVPILVLLGYRGDVVRRGEVIVTRADCLHEQILAMTSQGAFHAPDALGWLRAAYDPLPSLVHASRRIFEREPLPQIKRAASAGLPHALARLLSIAAEARADGSRRLVLVTGVPGSGKTLLGLQLVHAEALDALADPGAHGTPGVLLSGNDPLVDVLQYALKSRAFVQKLKTFLLEYHGSSDATPPEHVLVFDEAQRAWDASKVSTKHRGELGEKTEPELLLEIADRMPGWSVVVALVGEGQEIHVGEERGLSLWADALRARTGWRVHAPPRIAGAVRGSVPVYEEPGLDLDTTLRTHAAADLHRWVRTLLDGELDAAGAIRQRLSGYAIYVTRELDLARRYFAGRYAGQPDRRYGMLASSCATNVYFTRRLKEDGVGVKYGRWYEGSPRGDNYCCSLRTAVSEFGCQGLELDGALVCWGDDLTWTGSGWAQRAGKKRRGAQSSERLRINAYRVLLTRARDGMCVFVPPEPAHVMDPVAEALAIAGAEILSDA